LYRQAQPAWNAQWSEQIDGKQVMTEEQRVKARAVVQAFDKAANVMPWEHGPLSPRADGPNAMRRSALLAKVNCIEAQAFRRYARKWQKRHDAEVAHWMERDDTGARQGGTSSSPPTSSSATLKLPSARWP
jgi:hypothetical protein